MENLSFRRPPHGNAMRLKHLVLAPLRWPGIASSIQWLIRDRATIFTLHRFAVPDLGVTGTDPDNVRAGLELLRRKRYELLPLREMVRRLAHGDSRLRRAVSFTIDDGYFDQAEVAGPLFAEFDCPVTTFVCTGFLDGALWMWWDRIEYAFVHCERRELEVELDGEAIRYSWADAASRARAQHDFTERCKRVNDAEKHAAIERLAGAAGVELPATPPPACAPMSWSQVRACEERGMTFGPHTLTHPVLSRVPDERVRDEIQASAQRLAAEAKDPDPLFCYPNGQVGDFGPREFDILDDLGFRAAVVGYGGYATRFAASDPERFTLRRFSYPHHMDDMLQCVSGFERAKELVRGGA